MRRHLSVFRHGALLGALVMVSSSALAGTFDIKTPDVTEGQTELNLVNDDSVTYRTASGMTMATNRPMLKLAMHLLLTAYPASIPFDALRKQARENLGGNADDPKATAEDTQVLAVGLLNCYMGSDLIELYGMPSFTTSCRRVAMIPVLTAWIRASGNAMGYSPAVRANAIGIP